MHQQQNQGYTNNLPQPEPGGWGGSTPSATTNGWGTAPSSGWGAPDSGGSNWGRQPQVDNGTAVWGKPSQSASGWGAPTPSSQSSTPAPNAWNTTPQTQSQSAPNPNPPNQAVQHEQQQSTQQLGPLPPINQSSQPPESWAAAAAAPPTPGQPGHIPPVSQQSGAKISESDKSPSQTLNPQTSDESVPDVPVPDEVVGGDATDEVQQLVNSHEGWGKRPIQQNTSWDISESPSLARQPSTKTGTEAWGKVQPAQSSTSNWQGGMPDQSNQQWAKPATGNPAVRGWGPNPNHAPPQPRLPWGVNQPSQPQPGWGDPRLPPPMPNMNVNNRWNAPPSQMPSSSQGWGASGAQNNNVSNSWGNTGAGDASNWGANSQRPPQNSNWGTVRPDGNWNQQAAMQRQSSTVDDGTSAWGDPTTYRNVNMWDKKQGGMGDGQPVKPEATGWGGPPVTQDMTNKPPSPTGWGDTSNLSRPMVDNATSGWGKPAQNTTGTNWDQTPGWGNKPAANATGWGGANESSQQWGQNDGNTGWNQSSIKNEATSKGMEFGGFVDRKTSTGSDNVFEDGHLDGNIHNLGMESGNGRPGMNFNQFPGQGTNSGMPGMNGPRRPPQPPMNTNLRGQFQQAPPMPPQVQSQLQQIREAVMKGVIPQQMLNQQLMTPHHVNLLQQLVMKTTEFQQLLSKHNTLSKPNVPLQFRPQREMTSRMLQQCHQQIQACRNALTQNMLQKTGSLTGKSNTGALGGQTGLGLDMQPFNMSSISQSLPGGGSNNREPQSRLNTWRPSLGMDGGNDIPSEQHSHSTISDMIGAQSGLLPPGVPGGGLFGLQQSDNPNSMNKPNSDVNGFESNTINDLTSRSQEMNKNSLPDVGSAVEPSQEQDANLKNILADVGPPEFIPGKKWEGFRPIDPENDPDITPGSVAIQKTMSVNTVKDADQVLNRDRYTSQVGSPASGSADVKQDLQGQSLAASFANTLSDIQSGGIPSQTWSTASGAANTSLGHTPTSLTHELWKVPLPKQSGNRQQPGWSAGPASSWSTLPNNTSSSRYSTSNGPEGYGTSENKTWVVLTNLNHQMDFTSLRNLCSMKGHMQSFQPNFPTSGMVLVKYSTGEEATAAKNGLNMFVAGGSMVVASIASDQEVSNFVTASSGGRNWNSGQSGFPSRGSSFGSSGTLLSNQQQHPPPNFGSAPMMQSSASTGDMQRLWSTGGNGGGFANQQQQPPTSWSTGVNMGAGRPLGGGMWGNSAGSGYEDPARMMSPLHSLLPENLLGEQQM